MGRKRRDILKSTTCTLGSKMGCNASGERNEYFTGNRVAKTEQLAYWCMDQTLGSGGS